MNLYEYQRSRSLTLVQGHSDFTYSNFFFLETTWPIEAKFHMNNMKRDPLETQHPEFENSRLGFIESVHER